MNLGAKPSHTVKGTFDGNFIGDELTLDFLQGAHGRAFSGDATWDLPDPRTAALKIHMRRGTVSIMSKHNCPARIEFLEAENLKVTGDIYVQVLHAKNLELTHSTIEADQMMGARDLNSDNEVVGEPHSLKEITLRDSILQAKGPSSEIAFVAVTAVGTKESFLRAPYLEGHRTAGKLVIQTDRLTISELEAARVEVTDPKNSRVGEVGCGNVLHKQAFNVFKKTNLPVDVDLLSYVRSTAYGHSVDSGDTDIDGSDVLDSSEKVEVEETPEIS